MLASGFNFISRKSGLLLFRNAPYVSAQKRPAGGKPSHFERRAKPYNCSSAWPPHQRKNYGHAQLGRISKKIRSRRPPSGVSMACRYACPKSGTRVRKTGTRVHNSHFPLFRAFGIWECFHEKAHKPARERRPDDATRTHERAVRTQRNPRP